MSSESDTSAGGGRAATAFDLASIISGDDRADLSGQADHDALARAAARAKDTDGQGRPKHGSDGSVLDYAKSVPVRAATSVLILRESPQLEVFVQHRVKTMDFAAGVVVFPGGRVDLEDVETGSQLEVDDAVLTRSLEAWKQTDAVRLGLSHRLTADAGHGQEPAQATPEVSEQGVRTLLACAIREVEEETGQQLRSEHMLPWANIVTPPGRSKRFDTYFFVAPGAELADLTHQTTEATNSEWLSVDELLTGEEEGRYRIMRPTLALLTEVQTLGSVDAVLGLAAGGTREIQSIRPQVPGIH